MMNESVIAIIVEQIQSHLNSSVVHKYDDLVYREPVSHITCRDGTQISVQTGRHCYCTPRTDQGPWSHVEVMMISKTTPIHFEYPEGDVAGYIPIESVAQEILSRGNIQIDY